jgi:hypothetical protein
MAALPPPLEPATTKGSGLTAGADHMTADPRRSAARRSTTRRPRRAIAICARSRKQQSSSRPAPNAERTTRTSARAPRRCTTSAYAYVPSSEGKDHTRSTAGFTKKQVRSTHVPARNYCSFRPDPSVCGPGSARLLFFSCPAGPGYRKGDQALLRLGRRRRVPVPLARSPAPDSLLSQDAPDGAAETGRANARRGGAGQAVDASGHVDQSAPSPRSIAMAAREIRPRRPSRERPESDRRPALFCAA